MINYTKLWLLLEKKGMKKTDLLQVISSPTLAKLGKNENVNVKVISEICGFLNCQPGDIMEYISDEAMKETAEQLDSLNRIIMEQLQAKGVTEEQFAAMMAQIMPQMIKGLYHGDKNFTKIYDQAIEDNKPKAE